MYSNSSNINMKIGMQGSRLYRAGTNILNGLGWNDPEQPPGVMVRRYDKTSTKFSILKTNNSGDNKAVSPEQLKQREIKKANERLKNLERLEKNRQTKVKEEIERLEEERRMKVFNKEKERKENVLKRKRIQKQKEEIKAAKEKRELSRMKDNASHFVSMDDDKGSRVSKIDFIKKQKEKLSSNRSKRMQLENDLRSENLI